MKELMRTLNGINSLWGALAIVVFLVVGWNSLTANVEANGKKSDIAIKILQRQTVIMETVARGLREKSRDHEEFKNLQLKADERDVEMLRIMDRIALILDRIEKKN